MLVQTYWLLSLLFIVSAAAHSSSSTHHTSTTKKSSSSTHHTSTSTIKKSTTATSLTHRTSSSSTKSSTAPPTSVPSAFYLVAENTTQGKFDGYYFKIIVDPAPLITISGAKALQIGGKTSQGAATFSLNADGQLFCHDVSGPLYGCVSDGHPTSQTFEFESFENEPGDNQYGMVRATCAIANSILSCAWGPLTDFDIGDSDIVNGTQVGEIVGLGDPAYTTPFTIKVVPV